MTDRHTDAHTHTHKHTHTPGDICEVWGPFVPTHAQQASNVSSNRISQNEKEATHKHGKVAPGVLCLGIIFGGMRTSPLVGRDGLSLSVERLERLHPCAQ